jgi:hypothetical protein
LLPIGLDTADERRLLDQRSISTRRIIMNTQDQDQDTVQTSPRNSFPEPQTIPSGWDTSTFSSAPKTDSEVDEDESTDN